MYGQYVGQTVYRLIHEPAEGQEIRYIFQSEADAWAQVDALPAGGAWSLSRVTVPSDYPASPVRYRWVTGGGE